MIEQQKHNHDDVVFAYTLLTDQKTMRCGLQENHPYLFVS